MDYFTSCIYLQFLFTGVATHTHSCCSCRCNRCQKCCLAVWPLDWTSNKNLIVRLLFTMKHLYIIAPWLLYRVDCLIDTENISWPPWPCDHPCSTFHRLVNYQSRYVLTVGKPRQLLQHPKSFHKLLPSGCYSRFLLFLQILWGHQLVERLRCCSWQLFHWTLQEKSIGE